MLVVLAHGTDASARWAAGRLAARSAERVELVLVEALDAGGTAWRQDIGAAGARTEIGLADGRRLRTGEIRAVLNRMVHPPLAGVWGAVAGDADYARSELIAFAASWIRSLAPRVVNAPTPQGLSGRWRAPVHWRVLAREAGLPAAPVEFASTEPERLYADGDPGTTVLSIGGEPLGAALPAEVRAAVRRFAALAGTPVLGLRFAGVDPARSGWRLLDASPFPDLSSAGEAGIAALESELAA